MRPSSKRATTSNVNKTIVKEKRRSVRLKSKAKETTVKLKSNRTLLTSPARTKGISGQKTEQTGKRRLHQVESGRVLKRTSVPKSKNIGTNNDDVKKSGFTGLHMTTKNKSKSSTQRTNVKINTEMPRKKQGYWGTRVKMKTTHIRTFSGEKSDDSEKTRFCDVAFIDNDHVLVLDDKHFMWQAYGCRVCCFRLDGTLVTELLLPGYPWSVVVLSPREAVVTIRDTPSKGLVWLTIDIQNKSIEIARNEVFENTLGITYDGSAFIASHFQKDYMTTLDSRGKIIGKIPVESGRTFRCLSLDDDDTVLYSDFDHHKVNAIDRKGNIVFSLPKEHLRKPSALAKDNQGNIYVGNAGDLGASDVVLFDRTGKYVTTLCTLEDLRGLDVNNRANVMAVSHEQFISIYRLTTK